MPSGAHANPLYVLGMLICCCLVTLPSSLIAKTKTHSDRLVVPTATPVFGSSAGNVIEVPSGRRLLLFQPLVRTSRVCPSGLNAVLTASAASAFPSVRRPVERT